MTNKIRKLQNLSSLLEPDKEKRFELLTNVMKYSDDFLQNVSTLPAYQITEDKGIGIYDSPIQDESIPVEELLQILKINVDTPGLNPASGGHLGYIPGGGIFYSALGDYLAAVTNRYSGVFFASPGAVRMENMLTDWMGKIIGYPSTAGGNLTSGGSIANLTGIVTARDAHGIKGKDFEKTVVYLSEQVHHSVDKALRISGVDECIKRYIPLDDKYRMIAPLLEKQIVEDKKAGLNPWLVIASAGTTNTGSVDPITDISSIAQRYKLWLHIDAAYGGFFVLCDSGKSILKGLDQSDSIVMDPHKGLFLPYGTGAVLIKDKMSMLKSHYYEADYMQDALDPANEVAPADLSPELSKHFRGLRMWLPLKLAGVGSFKAALEEKILLARYFYERLSIVDGFELGPYPDLSVVTYRYKPEHGDINSFNKKLVNEVQKDGRVFISSTMLNGNFTLRLAVLAFRTHLETVDTLLEVLKEKTELLLNE